MKNLIPKVKITNKPDSFRAILNGDYIGLIMVFPVLIMILFPYKNISAQVHTETINKTAQFRVLSNPDNILRVYNINGSVSVEGYNGDQVRIKAQRYLGYGDKQDRKQAIHEVLLVVEEKDNQVLVYIDAPFIEVSKQTNGISYNIDSRDNDYEFSYDMTIQVPQHTNLDASTINRGTVNVHNLTARNLVITNVNGAIELSGIEGQTEAFTINGDIQARYLTNPTADSKYGTINGTIEVQYPPNLSADIFFNSLHGDLYTDFTNTTRLTSIVKRDKNKHGVAFDVKKFSPVRIGDGGPEFHFEVLKGDVFIKQIKS